VTTEAELLAAIAATAAVEIGSTELSDQTRLVYADWLTSQGDRRGELIILDYKERTTPGGLTHPDLVASLLRLAAEFGFPHLPDPDAHMLPWEQLGRDHDYRVEYDGHTYTLARRGSLLLTIDDARPIENITLTLAERWTDPQVNVIMSIVSRAIRKHTPFERVVFPTPDEMRAMPEHRLGPLPMYYSAEIIEDFEGEWMLRARDHARWFEIYERMMKGYSRTHR
jgi:uncharacterized protein (TIGR02996 family)